MVDKTFTSGVDPISEEITRVKGEHKITTADLKTESQDDTKGLQVYDKRALFATKTQQFSVLESDKMHNDEILKTAKHIPWLWECRGDPTILFSL